MTSSNNETPQSVVFIDSDIPDLQGLLNGLAPGVEAFVIDPSSDGLAQIAAILAANNLGNLSSLSIVGHGATGQIQIGATTLDAGDLSNESVALAQIGAALAPGGDLQLYACDTASGITGLQFISDLSQAAGVRVAASDQEIGQIASGENWSLDATAGGAAAISPASAPFTAAALTNYEGVLGGTPVVTAGPNSSVSITTGTDDFAGVFGVAELTGGQSVLVGVTTTANDSGDGGSTDTGLQVAVVDNGHVSLAIVPMPSGTTASADYIGGAAVTALTNGDFAVLYWGDNASDGANVPQSGANGNLPGYYVQVFSSNGTTVGNLITIPQPNGVANEYGTIAEDTKSNGFVVGYSTSDSSSDIIQRFSNSGSAGDSFEMPASFAPYNIAVDGDGNIFAQYDDPSNNDVYAYIPDGATSIASTGVLIDQALPSSDSDGNPEFVGVSGGGFVGFFFDGNNLAAETTSANGTLSSEITLGDVGSAITSTDHPWISVALADGYFALTLDPISSENFSGSLTGLPGTNQVIEVGPALTAADTTVYDLTDSSGSPIEFGPYVVADPQGGLLSYTDVASSFSAQGYPLDASVTAVSYLDPGPSIGGAGNTIQYYQGGAATPLDSSITVTDLQGADISSATVTISTGFQSGDTLSFNNGSPTQTFSDSATVSASQSGDVLTLTTTAGNATAADYQKALDSVTYSFSGDPTNSGADPTRTITWSVTDANGLTSVPGSTSTLDVYMTPVLAGTVSPTPTVTATSGAVPADASLTITDDNTIGTTPVATVTITSGSLAGDELIIPDGDLTTGKITGTTITVSNNDTTSLTLMGTSTTTDAQFQSALRDVEFDATSPHSGTRQLTWSFNDDAGGNANDSNSLITMADAEFGPILTTTPSPNSVTLSNATPTPLTDTATVSGGTSPTGSVTFTLMNPLGAIVDTESVTVTGDGNYTTPTGYTLPTTGTVAGTYQWDASYSGDSNNTPTSDNNNSNEQVVVSAAKPSISTSQQTASATVDTTVADQATVTGLVDPNSPDTVTFNLYSSATVQNLSTLLYSDTETLSLSGDTGTATSANYTATATGTDYWVATYNGDANNDAVTSGANVEPVTVTPATPTVTTFQQPTSATVGSTIADQATVSGGFNPTGTVTFDLYNNSNGAGTPLFTDANVALVNGTATSAGYIATVTGTDYWVATYNGDANNSSVTSGIALEPIAVTPATPTVTTSQQPTSATVDTPVSDTATVSGGFNPTGTVTFNLYNNSNGTGTPLFTDANIELVNGTATSANYIATATGTDYWIATYNGDANNSAVNSGANIEPVTVTPATPTVTTSQQPPSATVGSTVADQASVSGGFNPTGTVTFSLYNNPNGTGTPLFIDTEALVGGVATSGSYTATAIGTDYWVATYNGDANNSTVTSADAAAPVSITPATPSISSSQQPAAATVGTMLSDTATVLGFNPTGTVTFELFDNSTGTGTPLFTATENLVNGVATSAGFTPAAIGTDYWVATYSGDANNSTVTSADAAEPVTISAANPTLSTTPSTTAVSLGLNPVTLKDTADLASGYSPTGTITFTLFENGGTTPVDTETATVTGNGTYTTPQGYTLPSNSTAIGTYQWDATYSGDTNNNTVNDTNNSNEQVTVSPGTPTVTAVASSVNASASESFTPAQLFSASDAAGEPILTYEVEDETTGANQGFWVLNGAVLPNGQITTLTAAQLSSLSFVAGSASTPVSDTLEVAASDAAGLGAFTSFTVTAAAHAPTTPPTVTAANELQAPNLALAGSSLFSGTAFGGNTITSYEVEDTTTDSGHWMFNGTVEPTNQVVDVTLAQLMQLSFDTGYGSDTLKVRANDGTQWGSFTSFTVTPPPNAAPPAGSTDTLMMLRNSDGAYEFYDIGHNTILLDGPLGAINPALQVAGVGGFDGADTADLLMRDPTTAVFTLYDVSNNNITGNVVVGQVGLEWTVSGIGDFSTRANETDMLMRNSNTGAFEVFDIANNAITFAGPMGQVGLEWTIAGFGDFSTRANETDMLLRNSNSGAFEVYDIANNAITFAGPMGQVGLEWSIAGFGDFSTRANETDMLMRNSNTGAFEVFDIANNTITSSAPMGQVGLEWTIAGFGDFSGNANETDMLMRNSNTGVFELYDINNNTIAPMTSQFGQVGLEWSISGVSATPASAPPTTQLTQAMASFAPSAGTLAASSPLEQTMAPAAIGTALLTTNHA